MPRIHDEPAVWTVHKRVEALTKRVEKLDREVFKAIRLDVENCMPDEAVFRQEWRDELRLAVLAVLVELGVVRAT